MDKSAKLDVAVARIGTGKWINAGQTCIAPDYIMVHKDRVEEFTKKMQAQLGRWFGKTDADRRASKDFGGIINSRHVGRVKKLLDATRGRVVAGGKTDGPGCYVSPTLIRDPAMDEPAMREEIFGPLLPIFAVSGPQEAVDRINRVCDRPLALYARRSSARNT